MTFIFELLIGARLVEDADERESGEDARRLREWARLLREREEQESRNAVALKEEVAAIVQSYAERNFACHLEKELAVVVDSEKARFSTWYELFPRSCSPEAGRHGSLRNCEAWLPYIASMGFDGREVLNSDALLYGGGGQGNIGDLSAVPLPIHGRPFSLNMSCPPVGVVAFRPEVSDAA
jgi:Alpha-1,4-glucan:maltose-1-phosphate maltosyltransferase, domain N/S/Alpha amylase, C-terminal all-beta domain